MKKRILLIAPEFFNYHKLIMAGLEELGWEVVLIPDRPPVSSLKKIGIRKARFLFEFSLNSFYEEKLKKVGRFDRVLIIKGECITLKTLRRIREFHCDSKITLYLWDGINNVPGGFALSQAVDDVFSFDTRDARKYGFGLLPLFYTKNKGLSNSSGEEQWLVSFVGSIHSDRLKVISRVRSCLKRPDSMFVFVYFPSRILYWFRRFFDSSFRKFSDGELSLSSISKAKVEEVFARSRAVLDIQHPKQTGLTMRTIEGLSVGKKLITTNGTIVEYPFYDPANILVVDRNNPVIPEGFFTTPVDTDKVAMMESYELHNWIRKVLSIS